MTIRELRYVLQIAQCGSLSLAAQSLYVSQSTLSQAIKELEKELGIQLFSRTNRGISLTHEGLDFLPHARKLVEDADALLLRYSDKKDKQMTFTVSSQRFPFATRAFSKVISSISATDYSISFCEENKSVVISNVANDISELGVIEFSDSTHGDSLKILSEKGLQFVEIARLPVVAFLRKTHPLASQPYLTAEALIDYPYVTYPEDESIPEIIDEFFSDRIPSKIVHVSERSSAIAIIRRTDCYTIYADFPNSRIATVDNKGVEIVAVPYIASCGSFIIGYIKKADHSLSALTREYVNYLSNEIIAIREMERIKNVIKIDT